MIYFDGKIYILFVLADLIAMLQLSGYAGSPVVVVGCPGDGAAMPSSVLWLCSRK